MARALGWFSVGLGLVEVTMPERLSQMIGIKDRREILRLYGVREIVNGIGLLAQRGPGKPGPWMWGRVGGDLVDMATLLSAPTTDGDRQRVGIALGTVGAITLVDAVYAQMLTRKQRELAGPSGEPGRVQASVTIEGSPQELYELWRDPTVLPRLVAPAAEVHAIDSTRTRWRVSPSIGPTWEWETQVVEEEPGARIRWESLPETRIASSGEVAFRPAPGDRGTEVMLTFHFDPPGGAVGEAAARLLGVVPKTLVTHALRRLKSLVETGEIPTIAPQPTGRADKS